MSSRKRRTRVGRRARAMSSADEAALNDAIRDLHHAPVVLGGGRMDVVVGVPFQARLRAVCARCRGRIDIGDRARYHCDYPEAIHELCPSPEVTTRPNLAARPKLDPPKSNPVCSDCNLEHAGQCF